VLLFLHEHDKQGGALAILPPQRRGNGGGDRRGRHQRPRARPGLAEGEHGPEAPGTAGGRPLIPVRAGCGCGERSPGRDQVRIVRGDAG